MKYKHKLALAINKTNKWGYKRKLLSVGDIEKSYKKRIETRRRNGTLWHSEETKRKISKATSGRVPSNLGIKMSQEQKDKISKKMKGRRPMNWRGGSWVYWRNTILKRDNYTCLVCGLQEREIVEVAHKIPIRGLKNRVSSGHPLNCDDNLITLCPNDHTRLDKGFIQL